MWLETGARVDEAGVGTTHLVGSNPTPSPLCDGDLRSQSTADESPSQSDDARKGTQMPEDEITQQQPVADEPVEEPEQNATEETAEEQQQEEAPASTTEADRAPDANSSEAEQPAIVGVRLERARLKAANLKADLKEGTTSLDFSIQYDRELHAGLAILHERLLQLGNRDVICYVAPYQPKLNERTEQPPATREEEQQQLGFGDNAERVGEIQNMPGITWGDAVRLDRLDEFCRLQGYAVLPPEQVGEATDKYVLTRGEGLECLQIVPPLSDILTDPPTTWADLLERIECWFAALADEVKGFDDGDLIPDCETNLRWNNPAQLEQLGAFLRSQGYHIYEDGPGRPETWLLGAPDGADVQLDVAVLEREDMTWRKLEAHLNGLMPAEAITEDSEPKKARK